MAGLTIKELRDRKGGPQLTFLRIDSADDAAAAEAAGIDMIGTVYAPETRHLPGAAPSRHFRFGLPYGRHVTATEAMREAFRAIEDGAETVYTAASIHMVSEMAREGIPVIGHIGLVPPWRTWTGGYRAVGRTAQQAIELFRQAKAYEAAGAAGIEIEVVPEAVAAEITRRTTLITMSLGAGAGCDVQCLFARDVLGSGTDRLPRHAKAYRDFAAEHRRLQQERIDAFREFRHEVGSGGFPAKAHGVAMPEGELEDFLMEIDRV
ncbi:3-methyl-2-oxobutanoate hydroxymethyltransferase [Paralimibaculum aggregatum]|uniref:3-methyl-2-oxobutanoate hydroxymethyltransferase n=1 Tax=Paralimibaculum aggregatum TaxID=3036245 RepID=A0ABQ6LPP6_9RHOB|nr:3-methyl-2-oxobutanoate hydroxymethyltransferase [Limibaculum sp. NKW23]GMG84551.1 3-methyl-2-oxobutanoate hydroxymethyltransferase [Limibaculum sp. NKW23]